jgi:hypothetical protein
MNSGKGEIETVVIIIPAVCKKRNEGPGNQKRKPES